MTSTGETPSCFVVELPTSNTDVDAQRFRMTERFVVALEGIGRSLARLVDLAEATCTHDNAAHSLGFPRPVALLPPTTAHSMPDSGAVVASLGRIADALTPAPKEIVGTPYIAKRLGCTTVWVAEMARKREIPVGCVVAGTGNGKPWKFHRDKIDTWLESR